MASGIIHGEETEDLQKWEVTHSAEVTAARKPVADLVESCASHLEKYRDAAQQEGDLEGVLAARTALDQLRGNETMTPSEDPEVARIQKIYTSTLEKVVAETDAAVAKVNAAYAERLRALVVRLTKAGEIEKASAAKERLDALETEPPAEAAPTSDLEAITTWRKRAFEDFPILLNRNSAEHRTMAARIKELESNSPEVLENPKWFYDLAKQVCSETPASGGQIPEDAKSLNGVFYRAYREKCKWTEAKEKCEKLGGRLAIIRSAEIQALINSLRQPGNNDGWWLGATDERREGRWVWLDRTRMRYENWDKDEPGNLGPDGEEDYLTMHLGGKWNDCANIVADGYVCEWTPPED
ncbi:C-type lectin domain-containing protein [Haloferula sargassicola]